MKATLICVTLLVQLVAGYIESVAANVDVVTRKQSAFVPLVAFQCGYRNKYLDEEGRWVDDKSRYATCLTGKLDILKYCRKVYPSMDVTNIVEYSHQSKIDDWCKEEGTPCKWTHTVRPFQCIVGEFRSEALQVPKGCRFGHVDDRKVCDDFAHWESTAHQQCEKKTVDSKAMTVRSFAVLEPCGLDLFSGVEFVCCPNAGDQKAPADEKVVDMDGAADDDDDDDDDDEDDYYDDDDDDDEKAKEEKKDPDEKMEQDPYFRQVDPDNEHQMYKDALHRLERKHREKVAKVMREWSELDNRYKTMKEKDPKHADEFKQDMTARFQKTVAALEEEQKEQKQQINEVHQERVQSALNEHKRVATREFRQALANQVGTPNKHNVLKTLKSYIRAEEKDRTHMLNRYRHLLKTDQKEAEATKDILLRSLRDIDLRINGTFAMLRDFPELDAQVRPIAMEFWDAYRKENTPEVDDEELMKVGSHDKNVKLIELYKEEFDKLHAAEAKSKEEDEEESNEEDEGRELHVEIEPIINDKKQQPMVAHELPRRDDAPSFVRKEALTHDASRAHESSAARVGSSHALLMIVGSAVVVFAMVGIVVARRRRPSHAGFIEVDACTPEERHVSGMQVNGYENPTYNFFGRA